MPDLTHVVAPVFGRSRCVLVGRGTTAIALALRALGLAGAPVAVPSSVCYAVPLAVELSGNDPLFLDADPATGNVPLSALNASERPAALIAVTTQHGELLPMGDLAQWCEQNSVVLIEDATLAVGAAVGGRPAGAWGACAIVSFGSGKLVEAGVGAAVLTDDPALAADVERLAVELPAYTAATGSALAEISSAYRPLSWLGRRRHALNASARALFDAYGDAFLFAAPSSLPAALPPAIAAARSALPRRQAVAAVYAEELAQHDLVVPLTPAEAPALWRYSLRVLRDRDRVIEALWASGVDASAWYPAAHRIFAPAGGAEFPGAEAIEREVVNLWLDGVDENRARLTAHTLLEALEEAS